MNLLLTGAGFSRNWGGWLASEVFEYLLGCDEVVASTALRRLLWQHQQTHNGFESALAHVQRRYIFAPEQEAHLNELRALQGAISGMFGHMNRNFYQQDKFDWSRKRETSVTRFLSRFDALFTLNQDQLLEQHYSPELAGTPEGASWTGLQLPGMVYGDVARPPGARGLAGLMWVSGDPAGFRVDPGRQPLFKLHGSTGWSDHINDSVMILGDNKAHDICMFPILNWYLECFETYLCRRDARLMIIGYGFRDQHINEVITRAVREHGLKFYVIDPCGSDIASRLNPKGNWEAPLSALKEAFAEGLMGASRRSLREIFGDDNVEFHKVMRFFEQR